MIGFQPFEEFFWPTNLNVDWEYRCIKGGADGGKFGQYIFGTKLPPDNCFPWTGRSNTKIYKDIQRNTNIYKDIQIYTKKYKYKQIYTKIYKYILRNTMI